MSIASKAPPRLFKFKKPVDKFIEKQAGKENKTMTALIEETMEYRMKFKTWPPADTQTNQKAA